MAVTAKEQVDIAAALVRLYVFLAQHLDRCMDEAARKSYPDAELKKHLTETKSQLMDILAVNPVVKKKLTEECDRILALSETCLRGGSADRHVRETMQVERTALKHKTVALSDLVAVYRSLE